MVKDYSKRYLPVDIRKITECGLEGWRNNFLWPISDAEFFKLYEDVEGVMKKYITTLPEEMGDIFLIQRQLNVEYLNFLHALKVMQKTRELEMQILYADDMPWYSDIAAGRYPRKSIALSMDKVISNLCNNTFYHKIAVTAKRIVKNIIYNPNLIKRLIAEGKEEDIVSYGSVSALMRKYIKRLPCSTYFTSEADWLPEKFTYTISHKETMAIKEASNAFAKELRSIAFKNGITILDSHMDYLRQMTQDELIFSARLLGLLSDNIKRRQKKLHLLISLSSSPFNRALAIAVRRQGGRVTSFGHGGNIGLFNTPTMAFSEFALSDEFVTYTSRSIELFERIKKNHKPLRGVNTLIKSADSDEYYRKRKIHEKKTLPKKVKKVMMIGFLYRHLRRHLASYAFGLMQLDLELHIIDVLKKAGYEIYYKAHPDNLPEVESIFKSKVKVLKGDLANYLSLPDAFIFTNTRTTAFPITLCTNKPIIGFRMIDDPIAPFPGPMELLEKRCNYINIEFDERNRVIFNEKRLLEFMAKIPNKPDNEFIETYLFP